MPSGPLLHPLLPTISVLLLDPNHAASTAFMEGERKERRHLLVEVRHGSLLGRGADGDSADRGASNDRGGRAPGQCPL